MSSLLSWVALIYAIPVSIVALKKGYAGWGTATLFGALSGFAMYFLLDRHAHMPAPDPTATLCATGAILGWAYWRTIFIDYCKMPLIP